MPLNKYNLPGPQTLLVNLSLDRVDLVHTGSNTRADILLTKGKEQNAMPEDLLGLLGLLKPEQAEIVKSALAAKDNEISTLGNTVTTLNGTIEDLKKAAPATPTQETKKPEEEILKGASPELVELVKGLQGQITTLVERDAENLAKARYESVKAIPCEEAELKEVLKAASPAVFEVLKKAADAIEKKVLTPAGKDGGNEITAEKPYDKLAKAAHEIAAKEGTTFEAAFVKACDQNRSIYAEYVKEA